ncbi:MAG: hypothetical protein AB8H12_12730 [Lewinella sp.]
MSRSDFPLVITGDKVPGKLSDGLPLIAAGNPFTMTDGDYPALRTG